MKKDCLAVSLLAFVLYINSFSADFVYDDRLDKLCVTYLLLRQNSSRLVLNEMIAVPL
jgi:hypothetical protein